MAAKYDWIVLIPDCEGATRERIARRAEHVKGLSYRVESGAWLMGGATLEHPPIDGEEKAYNGSCIVAHAANKEEVMEEIKKDVFATSGVWDVEKAILYPIMTAFRKPLENAMF